ncbi:hypothetical protein ACP4OV_014837 [Aristida adscensionis]
MDAGDEAAPVPAPEAAPRPSSPQDAAQDETAPLDLDLDFFPEEGAPHPLNPHYLQQQERGRQSLERAKREAAAKSVSLAAGKGGSRRKPVSHSESSAEKESFTMAGVDELNADLHEEEIPDWMSQLFEKLDLELSKDDTVETNVAQAEEDLCVQQKLEADEDDVLPNMFLCERCGGSPSEWKYSATEDLLVASDKKYSPTEDEEIMEWFLQLANTVEGGGRQYRDYDMPDEEFYAIIDKQAEYYKNMKRVSYKETIANGIKWMSEECFLAFIKYTEKLHLEGFEHKFGDLRRQCFSVESSEKVFHHYNFTIEVKHESSDVWSSELYFAEVKQLSGLKSYFCCPLEPSDEGHCYGCKSQDVSDLKHPTSGGYEEGHEDICWPFESDTDCESDSDDDLGY